MICLDCGNMDIRFDENEKAYHCNNCGSRNLWKRGLYTYRSEERRVGKECRL